MFGKAALLIVCVGVSACALLAARQMRTQAAYEMAQSRLRSVQLDHECAKLRAEIAGRVSPEKVLEMASEMSPMKPLAGEVGPRARPPMGPPAPAKSRVAQSPRTREEQP